MPQGPRVLLKPLPTAPDVPLDQTPFRVTNPTLANIEDFILAASGLREGLSPEASKAATLGTGAGLLIPAGLAILARIGRGVKAAPAAETAATVRQPIKAYHGSPHDFDQFSLEKIGTGEGAQAYGHGLYFAENPRVAADYAKRLARFSPGIGQPYGMSDDEAARIITNWERYRDVNAGEIEQFIVKNPQSGVDRLTNDAIGGKFKGKHYEVALHASPDEFLDWDLPLSQQSEKVKMLAKDAGIEPITEGPFKGRWRDDYGTVLENPTGRHLYENLSRQTRDVGIMADRVGQTTLPGSQAKVSADLRDFGIKGIRYKDAGSRGKEAGTSNYVVFDDAIIAIMKKYGVALPIAAAIHQKMQAAQAQQKPIISR